MKLSEDIVLIMKFCYHKLPIDNGIETFDYYLRYTDDFKLLKKVERWCKKNCEKKYVMKTHGCWFQTREDAMAFKLRWL